MYTKTALIALAALPFTLAQISDDFEAGWDTAKWPIYAPDCNQGGKISLDSTTSHGGKNSIKVSGAGGYCGHIFFGTKQVPAGDVYVRAFIKNANALTSSHVSFITMDDASLGANKHLRIGGQNGILMYNRETDDATLPDLSPQGVAASRPLPANQWNCFEYHLGSDGTIETWLNGDVVPGLTTGPGISNPNAGQWTRGAYKPKITSVNFGWESYGGDVNTLWYDDIVIGSSRVGCGSSPPPATTTARPTTTMVISTTPVRTTTTSSPRVPTTTPRVNTTPPVVTTTPAVTTTPRVTTTSAATGPGQTHYGQCGGAQWTGVTGCETPYTCKVLNPYYSQCL